MVIWAKNTWFKALPKKAGPRRSLIGTKSLGDFSFYINPNTKASFLLPTSPPPLPGKEKKNQSKHHKVHNQDNYFFGNK